MTYSLGGRSRTNLAGLHPDLLRIVERAIQLTQQDFGVAGPAVRTRAQQQALYAQGRTKPGPKVTDKDGVNRRSNHQPHDDGYGHAVDLTPFIAGSFDVNNRPAQYPIALAMARASAELGIPITWGADWYDPLRGQTLADMHALEARYCAAHPGKDFVDLPHFEII